MHTSVYIQGGPLQEDDSASVYNNRAYYVDYEKRFQYNEKGMKSACGDFSFPRKKREDLWVLLMGGSAMEGMGSNKNGAWFDITNIPDHPYTENIAFYLQGLLQKKYPSKNVRVFNAAVSGFTINQSYKRYESLSKSCDFDWVISMDGVNECDTLEDSREGLEREYNRKYWEWESSSFHRFPMNFIVPITQHSAFFGMLKQELYYIRLRARMHRNETRGFPERKFWLDRKTTPFLMNFEDRRIDNSCRSFIREIFHFEDRLRRDGRKYLFLVQPYLPFRNSSMLSAEEQALTHYLEEEKADKYKPFFLKKVYDSIGMISKNDLHIQNMSGVHDWPGWTFVDYCHFTRDANKRIAGELADFIGSDGTINIFARQADGIQ
ncbi:MAG: hypothetical protein P4L51_18475 [Puia sp.]|nr:hypothetical protein [Puia sp.]